MAKARDYRKEYQQRQRRTADRLDLPKAQLDKSPLFKQIASGHPPAYWRRLTAEQQANVLLYAANHPRTPLSAKNIEKVSRPPTGTDADLALLRAPWTAPERILAFEPRVQEKANYLRAAIFGIRASASHPSTAAGLLDIGWAFRAESEANILDPTTRKAKVDLKSDAQMRKFFSLCYDVGNVEYIYIVVDLKKSQVHPFTV